MAEAPAGPAPGAAGAPAAPGSAAPRRAVNRRRAGRSGGRGPVRLLLMIAVAWGIYAVFFRDF